MHDEEFSRWVEAYIRHCHSEEGSPAFEESYWVYGRIIDALDGTGLEPELVWKLILAALEQDQSPLMLEMLAAGPLESLLARHGNSFMPAIEQRLKDDPDFRELMTYVEKSEIPAPTWIRLEVARMKKPW